MSESGHKPSHHSHHHRKAAPKSVPTAVITVSDTRTQATDKGGALVAELLAAAGHLVASHEIVADDPDRIREAVGKGLAADGVCALILTGGTGVAPRDVTPDTVEPLLERVVPGFGEIFRQLSYRDIGSAAILSRALAGLARGRVVFVIPGSTGAVRLAMEKLIVPELGHLAGEAVKTR
ncbi:MAG: molybdenum cofactor biosynthesis protein MoaB [Deltaproteobacteria bacterium]|nr:molybdenum cofactor biosynthesis protein MoaB [Deltaproteobacteria bacterium]MBW2382037.1 molybdenum cofactor biosynthesis protein MoaB [Deltaproteobacteria bacterium]MBW2696912.1 molybdenum cofactor biosynthesis protein MoaB [Deltaproteobacteria bacterium]